MPNYNNGAPAPQYNEMGQQLHHATQTAQPMQPQGFVPPVQNPVPQSPLPQGNAFIADVKTIEIMQMVHPEMASAMINIAIKKFAEETDFMNYFVKDEYRERAQSNAIANEPVQSPTTQAAEESAPEINFGGW